MNKAVIAVAACIAALASGAALAQAKPEDSIAYRQGVYKIVGWNMGPMAAMVKGDKPYNKDAFAKNAANLAAVAPMALEGFGPGTDKGAPTKAKAAIWTKMDDFKAKMTKMNDEATKLAAISKTGSLDDIKKQFGALGGSCKACHDDYKDK
jgi:cytochrome c556